MRKADRGYTEFGKQVKIMMITLNLSSRTLARELGYTESTLCDVLKGRNQNELRKEAILETLSRLKGGDERKELTGS